MAAFLFMAALFAVVVVGLFLHQRVVEGINSRIRQLEHTVGTLEKDKQKLQARLDSCNNTVDSLQRQLVECEQEKRELASKKHGE